MKIKTSNTMDRARGNLRDMNHYITMFISFIISPFVWLYFTLIGLFAVIAAAIYHTLPIVGEWLAKAVVAVFLVGIALYMLSILIAVVS